MKIFFAFLVLWLPLLGIAAPAAPSSGTRVNLQAQSSREIANDLMQAVMSSERDDKDASRAADAVNKTLREARNIATKYPTVTVESSSYQSYPSQDRNGGAITGWRVRAELRLKGRDFGQMTALIAVLQRQMQFNGLEFSVSPETRRVAENELIGEAVAAFRQRASVAQVALQATSYAIKELNISTQEEGMPRPMMKMAAQSARDDVQVTAPVVEAGTTRVSVQAAGAIELP